MGYIISGHHQIGGVRMGSPPGLLRQERATASRLIGVLPNIQVSLAYINVSGIVSIVSNCQCSCFTVGDHGNNSISGS